MHHLHKLNKFLPLVKIDEAQRIVFGKVTAEAPDRDGEICHYVTTAPGYKAMNEEFSKATDGKSIAPLREMHTLSAVGVGKSIVFDDSNKAILMGFKVVDDNAWKKVQEGVYTGFSQGGDYAKKWQGAWTDGKTYTWYTAVPGEVSLVDNPCLESARFEYVKADGSSEMRKFKSADESSVAIVDAGLSSSDVIRIAAATTAMMKADASNTGTNAATTGQAAVPGTPVPIPEPAGASVQTPGPDDVTKGKTKSVAGSDLGPECFAYVGDKEDTTTWKLPIKFPGDDDKTKTHIQNALARFGQTKGIPDDEKDAVKEKIQAAAQKHGIDVSEEAEKVLQAYKFLSSDDVPKAIKTRVINAAQDGKAGDGGTVTKIHKTFGMFAEEGLAKSLYDVKDLTDVMMTLQFVQRCLANEREFEGDDSPIPDDLLSVMSDLVDVFKDLVDEEFSELLAHASGHNKGATMKVTNGAELEKAFKSLAGHVHAAKAMASDHYDKVSGMHKNHLTKMHGHLDKIKSHLGAAKAEHPIHGAIQAAKDEAQGHHDKAVKAAEAHHDGMHAQMDKMLKAIGGEDMMEHANAGGDPGATDITAGGSQGEYEGEPHTAAKVAAGATPMTVEALLKILDERDKQTMEGIKKAFSEPIEETQSGPSFVATTTTQGAAPGIGNRKMVGVGAAKVHQTHAITKDADNAAANGTTAPAVPAYDVAKAMAGDTTEILKMTKATIKQAPSVPQHLSGLL